MDPRQTVEQSRNSAIPRLLRGAGQPPFDDLPRAQTEGCQAPLDSMKLLSCDDHENDSGRHFDKRRQQCAQTIAALREPNIEPRVDEKHRPRRHGWNDEHHTAPPSQKSGQGKNGAKARSKPTQVPRHPRALYSRLRVEAR